MKIEQDNSAFNPITIVLESREEANAMWDILRAPSNRSSELAVSLGIQLSNYFSNEAKL
jgi:hypothetical protein